MSRDDDTGFFMAAGERQYSEGNGFSLFEQAKVSQVPGPGPAAV